MIIFAPASRGTDPRVAATVTSAQGLRCCRAASTSVSSSSVTRNGRFDLAVRLVCGNEYLVPVFHSERLQINRQAVLVRHREVNLRDFPACSECGFAHL